MRIALTVLALLLTACGGKPVVCQSPEAGSGEKRIIAFGDSQTAGFASQTSPGCGFSYANQLSKTSGYSLINMGIPGSIFTDQDEHGAIMTEQLFHTDRVVMLLGLNDIRKYGGDQAHLAEFEQDLVEALAHLSAQVQDITIGTTLVPGVWVNGTPDALAQYRAVIHKVVDLAGYTNVRVFDPSDKVSSEVGPDGLHLSRQGQQDLAEEFAEVW